MPASAQTAALSGRACRKLPESSFISNQMPAGIALHRGNHQMDKLYVEMPTYNEEANIRDVVRSWYPVLEGKNDESRLVIADGGSKDRTLDILHELEKELPKLVVISMPGTDHGTKVWALYDYAIKNHADYVFQTDSDGQTQPSEFPAFWELRNQYDAVLGNRSDREDGSDRKFVENVLRLFLFVFFGARVPDANAPFRLMRTNLVAKYLYKLPHDFNLPNAMLCAYYSRFKENVTYRHITFRPRQGGKNFMNPKRIIKIGWQSLGNFYRLRRDLNK